MAIGENDPAYEDFVRAYEKLVGARKRLQETAGLKRTDRKRHAAYEYHRCAKAAYGKLHGLMHGIYPSSAEGTPHGMRQLCLRRS